MAAAPIVTVEPYESTTSVWFDWETKWDHDGAKKWMAENRFLSVGLGAVYLALLFIGRRVMNNRKPFSLRAVLALWNIFMAAFSIVVTVKLFPYFLKRTFTKNFYDQMCFFEYETIQPLPIWHDLFVLTKPMEFIDTLFIVLRKQPLHFLHYYHHITVVILCWFSLGTTPIPPNSIYYVAMNAFVHSIMYSYYCLRSAKISVPRFAQMTITGLQISQMIVGVVINLTPLYYRLFTSKQCNVCYEAIFLPLAIYSTYFVLFADYFRKAYFSGSTKPKKV